MASSRFKHEGSFTHLADGRWQGQVKIDGKRYAAYGKTKPEAQSKIKELVKRYNDGLQVKPDSYTIAEWAKLWLDNVQMPKLKANTFLMQQSLVNKHIIPTIGGINLQKITVLQVQKLIKDKLGAGLSTTTVKKIRNAISGMMKYAIEAGILSKNFMSSVIVKERRPEIKFLTAVQVQQMLHFARESKYYSAVLILVTTAMRRSELCGLKWSDIHWENKTVLIQRSVVKLGTYGILISDNKTLSSQRLLPLNDVVIEALKEHQKTCCKNHEYIYSRPDGQPIFPEGILELVKRLGLKIGVPHITVHMLRHTAASLLLQAGTNPKIVQELLGHSSITMTLDRYSHLIPGMKEQAVSTIASAINLK